MKKILIADDSATARMLIKKCLEIIGFRDSEFIEAAHGKEVLDIVKETKDIDLLITDLNMPVMDGEKLLKWFKLNPHLSKIPILVVTSSSNPAKDKELLTNLGAYGVINKPVSPASLMNVMDSLR